MAPWRRATKTRARKQKDLSRDELRKLWDAQLSDAERAELRRLTESPAQEVKKRQPISISEASPIRICVFMWCSSGVVQHR